MHRFHGMYGVAWVIALAVGAFMLLPDYYTLPILGVAAVLSGLIIAGQYWWGWLIVVAGVGLGVLGIRNFIHKQRGEADDADKAQEEVSRRFKGIREDQDYR